MHATPQTLGNYQLTTRRWKFNGRIGYLHALGAANIHQVENLRQEGRN